MQKRNVLNSPRLLELKKSRKKAFWGKVLVSFLGLVAVFAFLAYISRLENLNISEIKISGNKTVETDLLLETIKGEIAGKYLWLFPKTNILIYPQNTIKTTLEDNFKRLKNTSFSIENNKILSVSLDERTAKYMWCGASLPAEEDTAEKCYFLDEEGFIFDEAPYFSGEVYFKFYGANNLAVENPQGSYFSEQSFSQLIFFKNFLTDLDLKPVQMLVKEDGDVEIYLSKGSMLSKNPKILLKIDSDFQNVAENLDAALGTEPLKSKIKNKYSFLQYIDLRFGNKVYYKFDE
jgi:hypothetical protein